VGGGNGEDETESKEPGKEKYMEGGERGSERECGRLCYETNGVGE